MTSPEPTSANAPSASASADAAAHAQAARAALARAQSLLASPTALDEATRKEALAALEALARDLAPLLGSDPGHARSVGQFAEAVAHEATHEAPSRSLVRIGLDGLTKSVERFEERHPTLAQSVERIAQALGQIGI